MALRKEFSILPYFYSYAYSGCFQRYYATSGYRISGDDPSENIHSSNLSDEQLYQNKIQSTMLKKRRSPLRGFQKASVRKLLNFKPVPFPNASFFTPHKLPKYNSYFRYVKKAERVRKQQRENGVEWKTMDFWWQQQQSQITYQNIGLDLPKQNHQTKMKVTTNSNLAKESLKKDDHCLLDEIMSDWEQSKKGIEEISQIVKHFNLYKDLFGDKFFYPVVDLNVAYQDCENHDLVNPVYYGNELSSCEATSSPSVTFACDPDTLWTLLLVNPDGNLESNNKEYIHWFVGNICAGDISTGENIIDYLCPIPVRKTGYHRMVFVLFKQSHKIDYSQEKKDTPCLLLRQRTFNTKDFLERYPTLTPASLRFFQTRWEPSVQKTYHEVLDMAEPVYDYIPPQYEKLGVLRQWPHNKTLTWLKKFMPTEPIFPGGGKFQ